MERTSPSPLAQAIAAIFDLLIAALAEHAAEHPLLAPGIRATIRQIEQTAKKLDRMIAEWEATKPTQAQNPTRRAGFSLPPSRAKANHMKMERRREAMASLRLSVPMWNPATAPRAPPHPESAPPRAPPTPETRPKPEKLPRNPLRPGAAGAYPIPDGRTPPPRPGSSCPPSSRTVPRRTLKRCRATGSPHPPIAPAPAAPASPPRTAYRRPPR